MDDIKQLFMYTGINIKKEYWKSYDQLNKEICKSSATTNTDAVRKYAKRILNGARPVLVHVRLLIRFLSKKTKEESEHCL